MDSLTEPSPHEIPVDISWLALLPKSVNVNVLNATEPCS